MKKLYWYRNNNNNNNTTTTTTNNNNNNNNNNPRQEAVPVQAQYPWTSGAHKTHFLQIHFNFMRYIC